MYCTNIKGSNFKILDRCHMCPLIAHVYVLVGVSQYVNDSACAYASRRFNKMHAQNSNGANQNVQRGSENLKLYLFMI